MVALIRLGVFCVSNLSFDLEQRVKVRVGY